MRSLTQASGLGAALLSLATNPAAGQSAPLPAWADSAILMAPGPQYAKGAFFRLFAGDHHRDLWTTPIRVPVVNLSRYAGGLTPVLAHSGSQTKSIRFAGADGRQYQFRSVDKDPTARLAPWLQASTLAKLQRDGVSASHPAASLVASTLLDAAGVLRVPQVFAVLPDDPSLGEFRAEFKGMLGMMEERPTALDEGGETFAGARRIISPTKLFERIDASPDDRVDAGAFLAARLMDIFMGDRDRHRDQWRWASFDKGDPTIWQPISRDHDEAFVKLDGPALALTRLYYPPIVTFGEKYPRYYQLNWHAREVDRRFLVELDRRTWDSVATSLQRTLTDSVIRAAANRMPPEMVAVEGGELARVLGVRRDQLVTEALGYYAFLSEEVEVRATDAPETAELVRADAHAVDLTIRERGKSTPWFRRRFDDRETREVRLKVWGGNDSVIVRGNAGERIRLKVVGGGGDDVFVDSSTAGRVRFYDDSGRSVFASLRGGRINGRHYNEWIGSDTNRYPPREWGTWWRPLAWLGINGDLGAFIGGGAIRTEYGFRRSPFASNIRPRLGYATGAQAFRADLESEFHPENASHFWRLHGKASGIEVLRYYGLGNNTEPSGDGEYHRMKQQEYSLEPSLVVPLGSQARVSAGLSGRYYHTGENEGKFIATIQDTLFGAGDFGELGARLAFDVDTRDAAANPRSGVYLAAAADFFPKVWDVPDAYGAVEGEAATFLSANMIATPTLALRAGGRKLWGTFPFQQSAFIGGRSSVRGFYQQRFAGDASVYGNAELRLQVATTYRVLPGIWGLFGNADAGRVYVEGDSPGGWHSSVGGGIWLAMIDRSNTVTVGIAASRERTAFYLGAGFGF